MTRCDTPRHERYELERQDIVFAAMKPADMALGLAVSTVKATGALEKITDPFYDLVRTVMGRMFEKNNDLKAEGLENVPREGGVLFASNHQSWNDVQVIGATSPRRLRFLAKAMFEDWPVLRHLVVLSDSPFVRRGGDDQAIRDAIETLKEGKALVIFPEGTIPGEEDVMRHEVEPDTGLLRGKSGAVRLAIGAKVPIVPVGVSGSSAALPPEIYPRLEILEPPRNVPIEVRYGEPLTFEEYYDKELSREDLRKATKKLMLAISALVDHKNAYVPLEVPIKPLPKHKKVGVLLLHGFTGSLDTVNGLLPYLEKAKLPFRMPVLRGHGTSYQDLQGVTAEDWYEDAEAALLELAEEVDRVVVVGLSMGGLIALNLAMRHADKIAGVATMAAALRFADPLSVATPLMAKLFKTWPSPEAFQDETLRANNTNYPRFTTDSFASLYRYSKETESRLGDVDVPIAVLQSKKDTVVAPVSANIIYRDVASKHREIHWFERSGHEMGQDMEREAVFERVMGFVEKFRKPPARRRTPRKKA